MSSSPKFVAEGTQTAPRMDDMRPKRDLTLDDIQNEDWLVRVLQKVRESKIIDVDTALLDELNTIMTECAEAFTDGAASLPVIKEITDLELLAAKESRCVALLARVAEISISLFRIRKKLDEFWEDCEERINRYPVVSKELTNDRKRTLFYRSVLKPLREKQAKLELALEISDKIETHLNSVHFAVREISAMGRDYLMKSTRVDRDEVR